MLLDVPKNVILVSMDNLKKNALVGNYSNGLGLKMMFLQKDGNYKLVMTDHIHVQVLMFMVVLITSVIKLLLKGNSNYLPIIELKLSSLS